MLRLLTKDRRALLMRLCIASMLWTLVITPAPSTGQEAEIEEPSDLSTYSTYGDAAPIQAYFDHQVRLIPLGPALAHSQTEVGYPSSTAAIAWMVDGGVANGLHGTSTGNKVPTEASAKQPGGEVEERFELAGGPIGSPAFAKVTAGRATAKAERGDIPRSYATSSYGNVLLLPAAGSPPDPPGTYDPDAEWPGGSNDPAPRGQMGIVSIGHVASTSESFRSGNTVASIGVAEVKDINIGNRTSDNRCTNCIRIDSIRAEVYVEANGQPGGSRAGYRVILGRACRRAFDANTGTEVDSCLPLDPHDRSSTKGLQQIKEVDQINAIFEKPIWYTVSNGAVDYRVGVRIHAGERHEDPNRSAATVNPKDDTQRNYAYPDNRPKDEKDPSKGVVNPDRDGGQVAKAVAEGIELEITTITVADAARDAEARIKGTPVETLLKQVDEDDDAAGIQLSGPGPVRDRFGTQTLPVNTIENVRRVNLTLGVARAAAVARPGTGFVDDDGTVIPGGGSGPPLVNLPEITPGPSFPPVGGSNGGNGGTTLVSTGLFGPFKVRLDWSSVKISLWPAGDLAKVGFLGFMLGGIGFLVRRRLLAGG